MSPLSICNIFESTEMRNAYSLEKVVSFAMNGFLLKWNFIEESKNANSYVNFTSAQQQLVGVN